MSCWWKNVHDLCRTFCLWVVSQQELRTFLVEFLVSGTITHGIKSTPIAREEHLRWRCYIAWGNRNNFFDKWSKWNEMSSSVDSLHYYFLFWNYFELWYKVGRVSAWILTFGANQSFHTEILLPYAIAISWAIKVPSGTLWKTTLENIERCDLHMANLNILVCLMMRSLLIQISGDIHDGVSQSQRWVIEMVSWSISERWRQYWPKRVKHSWHWYNHTIVSL